MTLDSKLTCKPHIAEVSKEVNKALYSLRFIRACTTETLRKMLVESLVQPHLEYYTVVYIGATNERRLILERLSNLCVRFILGARRDEHITPYRRNLHWLHPESRRLYFAASLLYRILQMREPGYLAASFNEHVPWPTRRGVQPALSPPQIKKRAIEPSMCRALVSGTLFHLPCAICRLIMRSGSRCASTYLIATPSIP